MNTTQVTGTHSGTMDCTHCSRYVALIQVSPKLPLVAVEYAADGFTPTDERHVCRPRPEWDR